MDRLAKPLRPSGAPHSSRRRATTPAPTVSESEKPESSPVIPSSTPGPALPPIRYLHLPPTQYYPPSDSSGYTPALPHAALQQPPVASGSGSFNTTSAPQLTSDLPPIAEVSDSDKEESAPPKKRRKRQALSCTGQHFHPVSKIRAHLNHVFLSFSVIDISSDLNLDVSDHDFSYVFWHFRVQTTKDQMR